MTLAYEDDGTHEDHSAQFGSAVASSVEEQDADGVAKTFIMERFMIPEADAAKEALRTLVAAARL